MSLAADPALVLDLSRDLSALLLKLPALLSSLARFTIGDSGAVASRDSSGESGGTGEDATALISDGESGVLGLRAASVNVD